MTHIKNRFIACCTLLIAGYLLLPACTSAIISGRVTPDGRPILWKNRDTSDLKNCISFIKGELYDAIAVVNYSDNPRSIWIGTNEAGFSIMNTLSYNLNEDDGIEPSSSKNGAVMRRAIEICATVEDFKHYLDTLSRPMRVRSNYGVIDAQGGAAYFEINSTSYQMFDVNDQRVAPHGYLVRTNYSVSGNMHEGAGYVRYQEAEQKLYTAEASGEITPAWLFKTLSRSFSNPLLGIDLTDGRYNRPYTNGWFVEQDFIARYSSSCAIAIQGVKPDEDAAFTTMWTVIGYPPVTPAIPVWVKGADKQLPNLLTRDKNEKTSPLCDAADLIRKEVYSYHRGTGTELYFHWELLFNPQGTGYMQKNQQLEDDLFRHEYSVINTWRTEKSPSVKKIHALYEKIERRIGKE